MKNIVIYAAAMLLLASCGTIRKNVNKQESKTEIKSDSSTKVEIKVTEQVDTNIVIPGDTTTMQINESDTGEQVFETPDKKIILGPKKPGSKRRDLQVIDKPKVIPVKINRTSETNSNVQVKKSDKQQSESKVVDKTTTGLKLPWWIYALFICLICGVGLWLRKKI